MASLLFPTSDHPAGSRRKTDYIPFMSDVARASSDAADALSLFANLIEGTAGGTNSVGFMAFDAHGGDTGCQLRAGMMQELFLLYRHLFEKTPETWKIIRSWIDTSTAELRLVHENAKHACMKLVRDKVHPNKLGLGTTEDTPENMLRILGWDLTSEVPSLSDIVRQNGDHGANSALTSSRFLLDNLRNSNTVLQEGQVSLTVSTASSSTKSTSTAVTEIDIGDCVAKLQLSSPSKGNEACNAQPKVDLNTKESTIEPSTRIQAFVEQEIPLVTAWDPLRIHTVARFVVFACVLSKYKVFSILHGTVGARLAPDDAADASYSFVSPYLAKHKKPGKPQRILREFAELQSWLSDLSCAWQRSLAHRSSQGVGMERLLTSTLQQSDKGLVAMACYPGYLLARESWAKMNSTLLLIDRHFCDDGGFHYNIFKATMGSPTPSCICHNHPLGLAVPWTISQISLDDLINNSDSITPHIVIMGNSISGGHEEYMQRFANKARPHECNAESPCMENKTHIAEFLSADHDRLALSFFASHKAYAFPVTPVENDLSEISFVEQRMRTWASASSTIHDNASISETAESLTSSWRISSAEVDAMGTGSGNMRIFAWQHAFLETGGRVAERIEKWVKRGDLMPLHAGKH